MSPRRALVGLFMITLVAISAVALDYELTNGSSNFIIGPLGGSIAHINFFGRNSGSGNGQSGTQSSTSITTSFQNSGSDPGSSTFQTSITTSSGYSSGNSNELNIFQNGGIWRREIRLRTLTDNSRWQPDYTAQQILAMVGDLKPTMLDRYISGYQNPNLPVPVCSGCPPMNIGQFLQSSEEVSGAVIMARISLNEYDAGTIFNTSQDLLNIPINPPIRILSLDDFGGFFANHSEAVISTMIQTLYAQGWYWIEMGGCADANNIPNGQTNYASACFRYPNWQIQPGSISSWTSHSSVLQMLATMDFPNDIPYLLAMNGNAQEAAIFSNVAGNQSVYDYSMIYFVMQGNWDTNLVNITSGPYAGHTLYYEMKMLMQQYN